MTPTVVALLVLRAATIAAGTAFLIFTGQAYRKHRSRALLVLAVAIGLMVVGALIEVVSFLLDLASLGTAEVIEAAVTLLAFLVLIVAVSLHSE